MMQSFNSLFKLLLVSFLFLMVSCSKKKVDLVPDDSLTGSWKLSATYMDIGNGRGEWKAVPIYSSAFHYVKFKEGGVLEGNSYADYFNYSIKDKETLTFFKKDKTEQNYKFKIENGELTMVPAGPIMCIEGCGEKFVKMK